MKQLKQGVRPARAAFFAAAIFAAAIFAAVIVLLSGCGDPENAGDSPPAFHSQTYTIPAGETMTKLNLTPVYAFSDDETVASAEIVDGGVVITSKRRGWTTVYAANASGGSNSARIPVEVAASGAIKAADIEPFDESLAVRAVIKEPVTISGRVNAAIIPTAVKLMMDNNDFVKVAVNGDASAWIPNLPAGLSAQITYIQGGEHIHEVTLTVLGTPVQAKNEPIAAAIPQAHSANGWAVYVTPQDNAVFAVME